MADRTAGYATPTDLENPALGLPPRALSVIGPTVLNDALIAASDMMDSYLLSRYTGPIIAWGRDMRTCCCHIAAYHLLAGQGMNPVNSSADDHVRLRYEDALRWLKDVSKGAASPTGLVDSTPTADEGLVATESPVFATTVKRGW